MFAGVKPHTTLRAAKPRSIKSLSAPQRFYDGFTLIELSVVLFLIGLLFFTAMPKLGNFLFQTDMRSVARSLKATVHFLRSKSIVTNKNTALHCDLDNGVYWGTLGPPYTEPEPRKNGPPLVPPRRLPEGIRFLDASNINSPKKTLGLLSSTFNSKGVVEETVLHLSDRDGRILTIIINAYTGRFLLYDEYVDVEYGE